MSVTLISIRTQKTKVYSIYFSFQDDIDMLAKIPLIPALLRTVGNEVTGQAETVSDSKKTSPLLEGRDVTRSVRDGDKQLECKEGECDSSLQVQQNDEQVSLLQWISANNQSSVYQVAQSCIKNMEQVCSFTANLLVSSSDNCGPEPCQFCNRFDARHADIVARVAMQVLSLSQL
jgi:deferrochelatase/peroxidase EfeB